MSSSCMGRDVYSLPTTASPTLHGALRDLFGEAVMACDLPKPSTAPILRPLVLEIWGGLEAGVPMYFGPFSWKSGPIFRSTLC